MNLTEEQIQRYSRQIVLKEVGGIGQKKLLNSKVSIIGCGGLGSPVAFYLTAAGIGNIKIIDFDKVDLSNLHRQILHFTSDINKKKTQSAFEKLSVLNPDCNIELIEELVVPDNVVQWIGVLINPKLLLIIIFIIVVAIVAVTAKFYLGALQAISKFLSWPPIAFIIMVFSFVQGILLWGFGISIFVNLL